MSHRDDVLRYLSDGKWHSTTEITEGLGLDPANHRSRIHFILKTEARYGDVESKFEKDPCTKGGWNNRYWRLTQ